MVTLPPGVYVSFNGIPKTMALLYFSILLFHILIIVHPPAALITFGGTLIITNCLLLQVKHMHTIRNDGTKLIIQCDKGRNVLLYPPFTPETFSLEKLHRMLHSLGAGGHQPSPPCQKTRPVINTSPGNYSLNKNTCVYNPWAISIIQLE